MVGKLKVGDQTRQTHIRFRIIDDYESYINAIEQNYESEDAIFNGCIKKINTPQFNKVNRSQYGSGCVLNMKLLKIEVIIALYQLKAFVSSNVIIS